MKIDVEKVLPYHDQGEKRTQIETMFDNIAHRYDFLNHLLTAGIDISWRRRAIREIGLIRPKRILDMATGTGDFAIEALQLNPDHIEAVDLSQGMLDIGHDKASKLKVSHIIHFVKGDSEALQYPDESFDAVTVGFGVRNFQNLEKGLTELARVTRSGGIIAILEPSFPKNPIVRALFNIHFRWITPLVGKLFSKDASAYSYLPSSVAAFPEGVDFCNILEKSGFQSTKYQSLTLGICTLYLAYK